jgi:hypothetical protein
MRRAYQVIGWGIILLGTVHVAAASQIFSALTPNALWFVSGGLAMALLGAFNLVNHSYGATAAGVRRVAIAANVVMTLFGVVAGVVTKASLGEFVVIVGLLVGAMVLSLSSQAFATPPVAKSQMNGT